MGTSDYRQKASEQRIKDIENAKKQLETASTEEEKRKAKAKLDFLEKNEFSKLSQGATRNFQGIGITLIIIFFIICFIGLIVFLSS